MEEQRLNKVTRHQFRPSFVQTSYIFDRESESEDEEVPPAGDGCARVRRTHGLERDSEDNPLSLSFLPLSFPASFACPFCANLFPEGGRKGRGAKPHNREGEGAASSRSGAKNKKLIIAADFHAERGCLAFHANEGES